MNDMFLITAGLLSIMVSIIHGFLGETKVIKPIEGLETGSLRIIRAVWFLSAVYWFVGGVFLVLAPYYFEPSQKMIIVGITITMYLSGALANFWANHGRDMGWVFLIVIVALIYFGGMG